MYTYVIRIIRSYFLNFQKFIFINICLIFISYFQSQTIQFFIQQVWLFNYVSNINYFEMNAIKFYDHMALPNCINQFIINSVFCCSKQ